MPREYRSKRSKRAELTEKLRAQGWTWAQIAKRIAADEHVNMRVALRLAHNWTQESAARRWNEEWPPPDGGTGMTDKRISYWETWPITGNEPSLPSYRRLAFLYQCDISDLVEDANFSSRDEMAKKAAHENRSPAADMGAIQGVVVPSDRGEPLSELFRLLTQGGRHELTPYQKDATGAYAPVLISAQESERYHDHFVQLLSCWADSVKRRELLRSLGWAASFVAASEPLASVLTPEEWQRVSRAVKNPARADAPTVDHIEAVLWHARRQDDLLGPQAALHTMLAQRTVIESVLAGCPSALRPRLLSLHSLASRVAGWLSFDMGDYPGASFYYEQARNSAHEARNTALAALVLCDMSQTAAWQGKPRLAIDHAVAAQRWATHTDDLPLKAYAHQAAARAYAADGQSSALGELDVAGNLLERHTGAESVAYFNDRGNLMGYRSQCYLSLGKYDAAAETSRAALALYEPSFTRNRAFTSLELGRAQLLTGNVEEAASVIGDAIGLAACNQSPRLLREVRGTVKELSAHARVPAVRELTARCDAAGITGPGGRA